MSVEHDPPETERSAAMTGSEPLVQPAGDPEPDSPGGVTEPQSEAEPAAASTPAAQPAAPVEPVTRSRGDHGTLDSHNMLPGRERRRTAVERFLVRIIATCGIVAIGVAIAAIMVSSKSQGWLVGLVVSIVSVVLAAVLWSSRQL